MFSKITITNCYGILYDTQVNIILVLKRQSHIIDWLVAFYHVSKKEKYIYIKISIFPPLSLWSATLWTTLWTARYDNVTACFQIVI